MAIRNIRTEKDPILRKISKTVREITPRIAELIDDLEETMQEADGVGLAAVQVGVLRRVAVVSVEFESAEEYLSPADSLSAPSLEFGPRSDAADESAGGISTDNDDKPNVAPPLAEGDAGYMTEGTIVMINPTWEAEGSEMQRGNEGCLSVPGKCGEVERPLRIKLNAYDRNLEPYELKAEGLFARAIMHECDHMDGILYTDKVIGDLYDVMQEDGETRES